MLTKNTTSQLKIMQICISGQLAVLVSFGNPYQIFLKLSPFCILATFGKDGLADATPRGGKPGFIQNSDAKTLLIPDWPGNNRLDSLENIISNQGVGLLFLVPGIKETLRVNGSAEIITDSELKARFWDKDRLPLSIIKVEI